MDCLKLIDFHCDTACRLYEDQTSLLRNDYHIDLEGLQQAGYSAQWFAFFVHIGRLKGQSPLEVLMKMYRYFVDQVAMYPQIECIIDYAGYKACQETGKVGAFLSVEEGQVLEGKLDNLKVLEDIGIRLMTFTWNFENDLGYPHAIPKGLKPFGIEVLQALNTSPILLDISHLSEAAMPDILTHSKKPDRKSVV